MTNLVEKALIMGFGMLTLMIFFTASAPLLKEINNYNNNENEKLEDYMNFVDEINIAINHIIKNPKEFYTKRIQYPQNMTLIFRDKYAKFEILLDGELHTKILEFNESLKEKQYINISPSNYVLKVFYDHNLIEVDIF